MASREFKLNMNCANLDLKLANIDCQPTLVRQSADARQMPRTFNGRNAPTVRIRAVGHARHSIAPYLTALLNSRRTVAYRKRQEGH